MRSFFKKPSWATNESSSEPAEFFRRGDQVYSDIVATERKKRERKGKQRAPKTEDHDHSPPPSTKRRRISGSEEDDEDDEDDDALSPPSKSRKSDLDQLRSMLVKADPALKAASEASAANLTQSKPVPPPPLRRSNPRPNAIELDSDESESEQVRAVASHPPPQMASVAAAIPDDDDDEDDDDDVQLQEEFPELARKARERARRAAEARTTPGVQEPGSQAQVSTTKATAENAGPRVGILITSKLENTKPLLVMRRLGQNLKDVRTYWCQRQGFSPEMTASVFLTWKGKRLFDVTTCRSLGIGEADVDEEDEIFETRDEDGELRVCMEAVTMELLEAQEKGLGHEDEQDESEEEEAESEEIFRVIFKGPGIRDQRLKVRPSTVVAKVIKTISHNGRIPPDKSVHLMFDGDRLSPESTFGDTDIADLDCVDVVIR